MRDRLGKAGIPFAVIMTALAGPAMAAENKLDTGDTAWMLTATALVLLMTIPGLALFYGGMVRKQNVLTMVMQSFAICCLATILWMVLGYTIAFSDGGAANAFMGGMDRAFLAGMGVESMSGTIPETVFMTFQMTFAIITPALITGAGRVDRQGTGHHLGTETAGPGARPGRLRRQRCGQPRHPGRCAAFRHPDHAEADHPGRHDRSAARHHRPRSWPAVTPLYKRGLYTKIPLT